MAGRGAWTRVGMPENGTRYYQLLSPVRVGSNANLDLSHHAVRFGVKAIQTRINELAYPAPLEVDGLFGPATDVAVRWVQAKLKVAVDGQVGPQTAEALFWPAVQNIGGASATIVGGIAAHESAWDPGAVGTEDEHDLGLVQINGPANPTLTMAQRFDYHVAFKYATDRINEARGTPGYDLACAIASYGYPSVADHWASSGTKVWAGHEDLNQKALIYVAWIENWMAHAPS